MSITLTALLLFNHYPMTDSAADVANSAADITSKAAGIANNAADKTELHTSHEFQL